jgi:hypothetical protein
MAIAHSGDDTGVSDAASHARIFLEARETTPELLRETMWRLVDIVREILRSQRRTAILLVAFSFAFELLNRSLVTEASLAGIKLSRIEFLATLTPVAISYAYLRFAALARDLGAYMSVLHHLITGKFPGLYESHLDRMIIYLGGPTIAPLPVTYAPHYRRVAAVASVSELSLYNLLPLLFTAYAFWQLFSAHGPRDPLVWISLIISTLFLAVALCFAAMSARTLNQPEVKRDRDDWMSAFRRKRRAVSHHDET